MDTADVRYGGPYERPVLALYMADLTGGGAERMMINLARGFADRSVHVDLVLANAVGPYLREVPTSASVVDLASGGVLRSLPKLVRYLRKRRPDAMLVTLRHSSVVALWARRLARLSMPVFVREANTFSEAQQDGLRDRVLAALVRRVYPWADGIIAVAQDVAADVVEHAKVPESRVYTLYNPVITPDVANNALEPVDHPWFAAGAPPVILGAGRLSEQKDFGTLIRAFARLREQREARLVILGEGARRLELEALITMLGVDGYVSLPGFVTNPFAYMSRSAVFVLSSRWEGLPSVLIQAMACGCPVVSTDCPGGPREVLDSVRYGPLVPVGDQAALAGAICGLLSSPTQADVLRARANDYSVEQVIPDYLHLLLTSGNKTKGASRSGL